MPKLNISADRADCALDFVAFLEQVIQTVWDRYGPEMQQRLAQRADEYRGAAYEAELKLAEIDADIPF